MTKYAVYLDSAVDFETQQECELAVVFSKLTPSKKYGSELKLHSMYNCHTLVSVNSTCSERG